SLALFFPPSGEELPPDAAICPSVIHLLPFTDNVPGEDHQLSEPSGIFVERPESATATKGKDITFVAKVDSSNLLRKPNMKWLKGKWLDLGSKAGKHLQFKEVYDRNTKIYTYEMSLIKVVDGDAGGYRCEVTSKDKCDICTFEVTVQGRCTQQAKRHGDAGEDAGDLDFSALLKKRYEVDVDVWNILKDAKPCDYEKIAFEYGITDLRGLLTRLKKMKKVEPKKSDAFLKKLEAAYSVEKGKKIHLMVELADLNAPIKWLKNGQEIKPSAKYVFESVGNKRTLTINKCNLSDDAAYECVVGEEKFTVFGGILLSDGRGMKDGVELNRETAGSKYRFKKDGKRHILIINEATKEDIGMYHALTNGGESKAELEIEDKELEVLQSIADLTVKAAEQAMFKCEVSDEKVTGKWFKDGVEVQPSDRIKITHIGRTHKLMIDEVKPSDAGDYTFVPDGYALSLSAKLNFLEIKIDYVPRQDPPKIHLDTSGTGSKNTITVVAGNKLRLDVEITGEPAPTVCWMKGDEVVSEAEGRVRVESTKTLSTFVIEGAEKGDEGPYSITVTNPAGEDKVELMIKIVEKPGPPVAVHVAEVWGFNAALEWKPPKDDGNCEIIGYTIQKADMKTKDWFTVFEHNRRPSCTVPDLVMGNEYFFRVFSENICGLSVEAGISENTAIVGKTGLSHNRPPFKEMEVNCSPKFTAPLVDRSVIAGYAAAISCAVRGYPKPKIIWMKNNMIIGEDPRFMIRNNQGVLTLNIRKPSMFDGGKYSCRAINDLGQDEVECRLEVRVVQEKGVEAKK
uniref:Myosin binding protein Ca n=1 Tax=Cyclopterus lumpus TaxID=8103 RepID=A0A8C2WZW8_CYCLU